MHQHPPPPPPPPEHDPLDSDDPSSPYWVKDIPIRRHTTATLLSVFLGLLGADRFYLGHDILGFAKLLFTLFTWKLSFIVLIWWAIDAFLVITQRIDNEKFIWDTDIPPHYGKQLPPEQPPSTSSYF